MTAVRILSGFFYSERLAFIHLSGFFFSLNDFSLPLTTRGRYEDAWDLAQASRDPDQKFIWTVSRTFLYI